MSTQFNSVKSEAGSSDATQLPSINDPPARSYIGYPQLVFPGERDACSIALDRYLNGLISAKEYYDILSVGLPVPPPSEDSQLSDDIEDDASSSDVSENGYDADDDVTVKCESDDDDDELNYQPRKRRGGGKYRPEPVKVMVNNNDTEPVYLSEPGNDTEPFPDYVEPGPEVYTYSEFWGAEVYDYSKPASVANVNTPLSSGDNAKQSSPSSNKQNLDAPTPLVEVNKNTPISSRGKIFLSSPSSNKRKLDDPAPSVEVNKKQKVSNTSSATSAAPPAPPAQVTPAVEATPKNSTVGTGSRKAAYTDAEHHTIFETIQAVQIQELNDISTGGKLSRDMTLYKKIHPLVQAHPTNPVLGRTPVALKNYWTRFGRVRSKWDERVGGFVSNPQATCSQQPK